MGIWIANSHNITDKTESRRYSVWWEDFELPEEANGSNLTTLIIGREVGNFSLFTSMSKLRVIKLKGVKFDGIPASIGELTELRHLELIETNLERLPDEIRNLKKLLVMYCYSEMNIDLPEAIGELTELRRLVCRNRYIPAERDDWYAETESRMELPLGLGNLNKLEIFELGEDDSFRCVELIPNDTFRNMHKLSELSLPIKNFKILPPSFFQGLTSLKSLSFRYQGSDSDEDEIVEEDNIVEEDEIVEEDDVGSFLIQSSSLPLRILKIEGCGIKKFQVPPTSNDLCFPWLEELHIRNFYRLEKMQVMSQMALPSIRVLKITRCDSLNYISGLEHLQSLVELKIDECSKLKEVIQVAGDKTLSDHSPGICLPKLVKLGLRKLPKLKSICSDTISFPSLIPSIRVLEITICDSLERISGLEHLQSLVELQIYGCSKLEEVIQVAGDKTLSDHSAGICFPKLEKLVLWDLPQLKSICSDAISFPSLMSQTTLPSIRVLNIYCCDSLKHISGLEHLQSLVELEIFGCRKLEEVIQVAGDKTLSDPSPGICFPKLEKIQLRDLCRLKSICSDAISFPSLREFQLTYCLKLRVLPRGLVKENKAPGLCYVSGDREWYYKLQWQDEDFKAALDPHISR